MKWAEGVIDNENLGRKSSKSKYTDIARAITVGRLSKLYDAAQSPNFCRMLHIPQAEADRGVGLGLG